METLYSCCCGLDVHKDTVQACILKGDVHEEPESELRKFSTLRNDLMNLVRWLSDNACTHVAMESTGVYWQPIYEVLEEYGIQIYLVNARYMKNMPGRKTDIKDSQWIADLLRHGLLKASFVPDKFFRTFREYTRTYKNLSDDRAALVNRIERFLQSRGFKLSTVLSDILGVTGRNILKHLVKHGQISLPQIVSLIKGTTKHSPEEIALAVNGTLSKEQRNLLAHHLRHLDSLDELLKNLLKDTCQLIEPYQKQLNQLTSIPGISDVTALGLLAEIGVDMSKFASSEHLASWAGLSPRNCESAGKKNKRGSCQEIPI
ncbi:IS110 family transposase [Lucifera butyrica]|nr:IS110 family transposase [Lucifera butyrica]